MIPEEKKAQLRAELYYQAGQLAVIEEQTKFLKAVFTVIENGSDFGHRITGRQNSIRRKVWAELNTDLAEERKEILENFVAQMEIE